MELQKRKAAAGRFIVKWAGGGRDYCQSRLTL
jgi:hypothetical protein